MAKNGMMLKVDDSGTQRFLKGLSASMTHNALRSIARSAAKPIVKRAREIAPESKESDGKHRPGTLKRSIMTKTSRFYSGVFVGPNYKNKGKDGRYGVNVAFGFKNKKGRRGAINPHGNFITEAASQVRNQVDLAMRAGVLKVMRREIRRRQ